MDLKNSRTRQFFGENPCVLTKTSESIFVKELLRGLKNECDAIYNLYKVIIILDKTNSPQ